MLSLLKYLKLIGLLKEVNDAYKEDNGKNKPFYLSRRFIGSVIALGGGFAAVQFGVTIDADILSTVTDSTEKLISAGVVLYGAIMAIIGLFKRKK